MQCPVCKGSGKLDDEDGVIRFSVTSDGTTGEQWVQRLENQGYRLSRYVKKVLRSKNFKPTSVITTKIAVLNGNFFGNSDMITEYIRKEASNRGLTTLHAEAACLMREKVSDEYLKEMGLWWIVTMPEPIEDSDGVALHMDLGRFVDGCRLDLRPYSRLRLARGFGFAFADSQSKS